MKKVGRAWSSNVSLKTNNKLTERLFSKENIELFKINVKIIDAKICQNSKTKETYVNYIIGVYTDYHNWTVDRRYKEFLELNDILKQTVPKLNELFPPKKYNKTSPKVIEERKKQFNIYLNYLFNETNVFQFVKVLEFIKMPKDILKLFMRKHSMIKKNEENIISLSLKKSLKKLEKMGDDSKSFNNEEGGDSNHSSNVPNSKEEINNNLNKIKSNKKINFYNSSNNNKNNTDLNGLSDSPTPSNEGKESNENNYYRTLFEYEKHLFLEDNDNDNINNIDIMDNKANLVIEEFLRNLSQNIDNKTEVLKQFENFLKKGKTWPYFEEKEIEKLFIGYKKINKEETEDEGKISGNIIKCRTKENLNDNIYNNKLCNSDKKLKQLNFDFNKKGKEIVITPIIKKRLTWKLDNFNKKDQINSSEESSSSEEEEDEVNNIDDNKYINGLFQHIGNFRSNMILSVMCLEFLKNLLDNEYNPEYEFYIKVFKKRTVREYLTMKLADIIMSNNAGDKASENAMKILYKIFLERDDEEFKKVILKNNFVIKNYERFLMNMNEY